MHPKLKRRIDQSRENLKIVKKRDLSRDTSPMYEQQLSTLRDCQRAKAFKDLLQANGRWNEERLDAAKKDIRRIVGAAKSELRKKLIYSWEKRFIKDKEEENTLSLKNDSLEGRSHETA